MTISERISVALPSVRPSVCLSAHPSLCPFVLPSVRLFVRPFVRPSVNSPSVSSFHSSIRSVFFPSYLAALVVTSVQTSDRATRFRAAGNERDRPTAASHGQTDGPTVGRRRRTDGPVEERSNARSMSRMRIPTALRLLCAGPPRDLSRLPPNHRQRLSRLRDRPPVTVYERTCGRASAPTNRPPTSRVDGDAGRRQPWRGRALRKRPERTARSPN